ncbi:hypothetical protein L7F22_031094 [Adiantum nelumboides]|nr:hypothetical protein [Adiantum nelumboides]
METSTTALDNKKPDVDLFAIYENLNESFLELTFSNFVSSNRNDHPPNQTQQESVDQEGPTEKLARAAAEIKLKLNHVINQSTTEERDNGELKLLHLEKTRVKGRLKLNEVIKHIHGGETARQGSGGAGDQVLKRGPWSAIGGGETTLMMSDVLSASTLKSSSAASVHKRQQVGVGGGAQQAAVGRPAGWAGGGVEDGAEVQVQRSRTPPPPQSSANRCASCNKFILFARTRCSALGRGSVYQIGGYIFHWYCLEKKK